jgi:hypothetical protein
LSNSINPAQNSSIFVRQLHDQAENNHPERGFVFMETVESLLSKGIHKNKKPCEANYPCPNSKLELLPLSGQ